MQKKNKFQFLSFLTGFLITVFSLHPHIQAQNLSRNEQNSLLEKGYRSNKIHQLPQKPGLDDYEKTLLSNNAQIRAAYGLWQAEVKKIAYARGLPDPKINFGYFLQNIETAVGPQEYKIGFMQMIPWLGKLIVQGNIQALKADAAFQKLQSIINATLLKLRILYYENYFLEQAIDITRQNIDLVKNWEGVILSQYKSDMTRHSNLIKTQIEAIKLEDDLETLEARRTPLIESFRALLNLELFTEIYSPDSLSYQPLTFTKEEIEKIVLENNPELIAVNLMHHAAEKTVSRARMNFIPDFSIGVDYIETGEKYRVPGQPVPESGKDPLIVMGSVSIPLWFHKQASGVGSAKHQEKEAKAKARDKENMTRAELESLWFELEDAARKVSLYRDILIPKSLESLRASEKAYIGDSVDFLNIIDSQKRYLAFQLTSERALVRYHKTWARLGALAGRTL